MNRCRQLIITRYVNGYEVGGCYKLAEWLNDNKHEHLISELQKLTKGQLIEKDSGRLPDIIPDVLPEMWRSAELRSADLRSAKLNLKQ